LAGRTGIFGQEIPRASDKLPIFELQFLEPAGYFVSPARNFETRTANHLLNGKEARVFWDALDEKRRAKNVQGLFRRRFELHHGLSIVVPPSLHFNL
jgi:hypothetical protein